MAQAHQSRAPLSQRTLGTRVSCYNPTITLLGRLAERFVAAVNSWGHQCARGRELFARGRRSRWLSLLPRNNLKNPRAGIRQTAALSRQLRVRGRHLSVMISARGGLTVRSAGSRPAFGAVLVPYCPSMQARAPGVDYTGEPGSSTVPIAKRRPILHHYHPRQQHRRWDRTFRIGAWHAVKASYSPVDQFPCARSSPRPTCDRG